MTQVSPLPGPALQFGTPPFRHKTFKINDLGGYEGRCGQGNGLRFIPPSLNVILITKEMNTGLPVSVDAEGAIGGSIASTYGSAIMLGSNKSIIGIGDKGFFNRAHFQDR